MPVFWNVPRTNLHAVVDVETLVDWLQFQFTFFRDAKSSLAVLHNQNDMVTHFKGHLNPRRCCFEGSHNLYRNHYSYSCANRNRLRTGGRKASFHDLPQKEQDIQLEEAYRRATVALTRAWSLCVIMGPLDMKELLGAATVIGSLMYEAEHVFKGQANFYLHGAAFGIFHLMQILVSYWKGATVLLHSTFYLLQLRRHCKIMFLIGTRPDCC